MSWFCIGPGSGQSLGRLRSLQPGRKGWSGMRRILGLVIASVLAASAAGAQDPVTRFHSGVDLVGLNVVATDAQGRLVKGLASTDFTVFEDGQRQDVSVFAVVPAPIDLALLLDTSASMADKISTVQQVASGFTAAVRPSDRISVVEIKDAIRVLHPLNEDVAGAKRAIGGTYARGNTALYNGVYMTLKELVRQRPANGDMRRQAIVVLSDGDDTSSLVSVDDLMDQAKHAGVAIYTISLRTNAYGTVYTRDQRSHAESQYVMKALASETGARAFFPTAVSDLAGIYDAIADELANQYLVGYVPKNAVRDGSYRRVDVRIERAGIRARTRAGYVATPSSSAASR
jgi:Ca-activated chloride channel homolog